MIDPKELRIGNHATYFDEPLIIEPEDFTGIYFDKVEPIPLTPELLEKCGFESYESGDIFGAYRLEDVLKVSVWHENSWVVNNMPPRVPLLKYLHQLQNLYFALTGQELEVKQPIDQP